jgi:hypothetical protein
MAEKNWGNCKNCKYFASHNAQPEGEDVAQCKQPNLSAYALRVSGDSGCNAFEARVAPPAESPAPMTH